MTITVTQRCNGCGTERDLAHPTKSENNGWREVKPHIHLCSVCIEKAIRDQDQRESKY